MQNFQHITHLKINYLLLLFFSFIDKKQLLSGCPTLYQNKLQEQGFQDVKNRNKISFKQYGDLADQAFSQLMRSMLTIKNDITKLKIMEHHQQIILINMIQETKLLQFKTLCNKYCHMIKLKKA